MSVQIYLQSIDDIKSYDKLKDIPDYYREDITGLTMIDMNISGISKIGTLFPNLENLQVGCNRINKLDLTNFPNLKVLRANKNNISEIIGLSNCLKLTEVELQCNKIQYLEPSNSIVSLCIPGNKLKVLFNFPNLELLEIGYNFNFEQIINCPKLKHISAEMTLLTKEQFNNSIECEL